jgi:hypothetical protein
VRRATSHAHRSDEETKILHQELDLVIARDAPGAGANRRGDGEYDSIKAEEANHELSDWEGEGRGSVATRLVRA